MHPLSCPQKQLASEVVYVYTTALLDSILPTNKVDSTSLRHSGPEVVAHVPTCTDCSADSMECLAHLSQPAVWHAHARGPSRYSVSDTLLPSWERHECSAQFLSMLLAPNLARFTVS